MISVLITGILITIDHYFKLGMNPLLVIIPAIFVIIPFITIALYMRNESKVALGTYVFLNLWIIIGFGIVDGFFFSLLALIKSYLFKAVFKLHGMSYTTDELVDLPVAITGSLVFLASIFVLNFLLKLRRNYKTQMEEA